jgi:O-antigen ligase
MSAAPADAARGRFAPALRADQLPWYLSYSAILLFYLYASRFVPDVLLVLVAAFMLLIGGVRINRSGMVVVLAVAAFIPLQIVLLGGQVEDPGQVLHLLYLLPLTLALDDSRFDPGLLVRFCRATTLVNVALLALLFVPPLRDLVFWGGDRGVARYQSVLPEPSFVGVYSVLNFFVLLRHGDPRWAYANLLPLGASFSFAGLAAFATLGLFFARSVWRQALLGVLIIVVLMAAFFVVAPEMFTAMVANRVIEATGGGRDESVTLRIVAPLDLVRFTFQEGGLRAVLGLGLGNVEHYIYYEQAALEQHWRASGERSAQPDSVVAFVMAAFGTFGIFAMAAFAVWILLRRWSSRAYDALRPFLLVIALFTGLFISVHFWVWIFLLRQEQLFRESAAARPATPVPGR